MDYVIGKEALKIKMLKQVLIEKSVNFFGTCSERGDTKNAGEAAVSACRR